MFDLTKIHIFSCLCYISTIIANRKMVDLHVKARIFLEFKPQIESCVVYDLQSHSISVYGNVMF